MKNKMTREENGLYERCKNEIIEKDENVYPSRGSYVSVWFPCI